MSLINCEINLVLTWSVNCVIVSTTLENQSTTFAITDTKLYVSVVFLSTQGNVKLLDQLKSGFKGTIHWSKYQKCQQKVNFKTYYKMVIIDLSKQKALDPEPKAIKQINFTGNLDQAGNATKLFIIEEAKEINLDISEETVRGLQINFALI